MALALHFLVGLIFGLGLVIAGMSNPAKVLNFLDLGGIRTGVWDPSLMFVMAGAIAVTIVGYRLVLRRGQPIFDDTFHLPTATDIDARIITGPAIFGIGWGLAGFCPGPAFTALTSGGPAIVFLLAMLAGMVAARTLANQPIASVPSTAPN